MVDDMSASLKSRVTWLLTGVTLLAISNGGCRAYNFGNQGLYRPDVRTVHVSIFESESYRRWLGQRLTESVVKQIERDTSFSIAPPRMADSFIRGRILRDTKNVLTESGNDDVREAEVGVFVEVTWTDRSGMSLMPRQKLLITETDHFVPEGGQSMTTAQQEILNRVATQIVNQMEIPW